MGRAGGGRRGRRIRTGLGRLHRTQSTVTYTIKKLEELLA